MSVSNNTKKDILDIVNIPENKINVIYEAANEKYKKITNKKLLTKIKQKYSLKAPFIFYAGSISLRKNIKKLLLAFQEVPANLNLDLVITGNKLWNNKEEMQLIQKNQRIKLLGFIPDEDLPVLYNLAHIYIYPSLYEGFGLPLLEAQACGCPVIASNASSLPEIANNSALLINPDDENSIKDAIAKLAKNKELRESLIKKGFANAKAFSWDKTARQTLEVLKG